MQCPAVSSHAFAAGALEPEGSMSAPVQVKEALNRPTPVKAPLAPLALRTNSELGGGFWTASFAQASG